MFDDMAGGEPDVLRKRGLAEEYCDVVGGSRLEIEPPRITKSEL